MKAQNAAIIGMFRDTVNATFDEKMFREIAEEIRNATSREIVASDEKLVKVVQDTFGFTEEQADKILDAYCESRDRTQFGLATAVNSWQRIASLSNEKKDAMEDAAATIMSWNPKKLKEVEMQAVALN